MVAEKITVPTKHYRLTDEHTDKENYKVAWQFKTRSIISISTAGIILLIFHTIRLSSNNFHKKKSSKIFRKIFEPKKDLIKKGDETRKNCLQYDFEINKLPLDKTIFHKSYIKNSYIVRGS